MIFWVRSGEPPRLKREVADCVKPIQASALSVVSATTLLVAAVKSVLTNPEDSAAIKLLTRYSSAIDEALAQIAGHIRAARDAKCMAGGQ